MTETEGLKRHHIEDNNSIGNKKQKLNSDDTNLDDTFSENFMPGSEVNRKIIRKAGPYQITSEVPCSKPIKSIVQYLAKKENTNSFYHLKILQLPKLSEKESSDERQGKSILHTEYTLLSFLAKQEGVIKQHGFFSDIAYEEFFGNEKLKYTGRLKKRLILVLDCLIEHQFDDKSAAYFNLQEYVLSQGILQENEAIFILYEITKVLENIHKTNVIHRDLKLGNIIVNKNTKKIIITNFCLGKYLINEDILLYDKKGSPAYISPDVICGKAYKGKPSDMWAVGVMFYIMLFGNFPFVKSTSLALFAQINSGRYEIPADSKVSKHSINLLSSLLTVNSTARLTAENLRKQLESLLNLRRVKCLDQIVPCSNEMCKSDTKTFIASSFDQMVPICYETTSKNPFTKSKSFDDYKNINLKLICNSLNDIDEKLNNTIEPLNNSVGCCDLRTAATTSHNLSLEINQHSQNHVTPNLSTDRANIFTSLLNHYFVSGRILPPNNNQLREFDGIITNDLATKLISWLNQEFHDNILIQQILIGVNASSITKIKNLLLCLGVKIESSALGPFISNEQSINVLLILTYLLKVAGYNNTYFITQLDTVS